MVRRRRRSDEDEEEGAGTPLALSPTKELNLLDVLSEKVGVTSYLAFSELVPAVRSNWEMRTLVCKTMTVTITFDVGCDPIDKGSTPWRLRTVAVHRVPQCLGDAPRIHLGFTLREMPLKKAVINRKLTRMMPSFSWEDVAGLQLKSHTDLAMLDRSLLRAVVAALEVDGSAFLEESHLMRSVERVTLSLAQVVSLPPGTSFPQIKRLKVLCRESCFNGATVDSISAVFPSVQRLHLAVLPSALVTLCGPGFSAPPDLRLSVLTPAELADNAEQLALEQNFFVASHLFSLPFNWKGGLFTGVLRLQMSELSVAHEGLAIDNLSGLLQGMPQLKRLGTVSPLAAAHLGLFQSQLEELVVVTEMDSIRDFFKVFVPLEKDRKRSHIRRLAVHLLASDGCSKLTTEEEGYVCAGWYQIACTLLHPAGFVVFSADGPQIYETVPFQLPWFEPAHFSLDRVTYETGRVPRSTPIEQPLQYCCRECIDRPGGTLVTGSLRPSSDADAAQGSPAAKKSKARSGDTKHTASWMSFQVADVVEALRLLF